MHYLRKSIQVCSNLFKESLSLYIRGFSFCPEYFQAQNGVSKSGSEAIESTQISCMREVVSLEVVFIQNESVSGLERKRHRLHT
jgi:hypothetical protein